MKRRQFLQNTSAYLAGAALVPTSLKAAKRVAANDKINIAAIGINGMGWMDLMSMLKNPEAQCVALCDVDKNVLDKRVGELSKNNINVKTYDDYRKLLEDKSIDAIIIGTPDHWHCKIMADACEAGKDVYTEKPVANSIVEARLMKEAQEKYNKVVQVGQWQRSQKHFADAIDYVYSGKLGNIRLCKAWAYMGWMPPIPQKPDSPVPPGVDYAMWLGPAEKRPFNENRFHFNFRWFWDYAGGLMTDWGVHLMDYALLGMKAQMPNSIMAGGGKFAYPNDAEETPDTLTAVYQFNGFNIQWEHAVGINDGPYGRDHGIAYIGNNGTLVLDRGGWEVIPEVIGGKPLMEAVPRQKASDNGLDYHTKNFIDVVQSRELENLKAPIQVGAHVASVCHMGNIAYRTGNKLFWDESKSKFTNKEANDLLASEYHNGFKMPVV